MPDPMRMPGGVRRGAAVTILVDGSPVTAHLGETIAAALLASGRRTFRHTVREHAKRGMFCGMGVCFECEVYVDGRPNVRACMTEVRDGMSISTNPYGHDHRH